MALIVCPDCEAEVSDTAPTCPKCGRLLVGKAFTDVSPSVRSMPNKSWRLRTIILLSCVAVALVCLALAVCFVPALQAGRDDGDASPQSQPTNSGSSTRHRIETPKAALSPVAAPSQTYQTATAVMPTTSLAQVSGVLSVAPFDVNLVMQKMPSMSDQDGRDVRPSLVFSSPSFSENGSILRYIVVSYAASGECRPCSVTLGGAVFTEQSNEWVPTSWTPNLANVGSFGAISFGQDPSKTATAFDLGGHHVVAVRASDGGTGEQDTSATLLAVVHGKVTLIWSGSLRFADYNAATGMSDRPTEYWDTTTEILPTSTNGWPDLLIKTVGVGAREDGLLGNINRTEIFQFDGGGYGPAAPPPPPQTEVVAHEDPLLPEKSSVAAQTIGTQQPPQSAIDVWLKISSSVLSDGMVSGTTNLPEGTALTLSLAGPPSSPFNRDNCCYYANVSVSHGSFGPASVASDGVTIPPGSYTVHVIMQSWVIQPANVVAVIGEHASNLVGPLVRGAGGVDPAVDLSFHVTVR